jgi:predicted NAD/FAD-dependent oxidoreductase
MAQRCLGKIFGRTREMSDFGVLCQILSLSTTHALRPSSPYAMATKPKAIAIIGGGIAGATAAQTLSKYANLTKHLFDQGRRGVGGRTSSRSVASESDVDMKWDHGCQFFRADTPQFQKILHGWVEKGFVKEWKGNFVSSASLSTDREFFGLPSHPPFFVGSDGMQSIAQNVLKEVHHSMINSTTSSSLQFTGTRVSQMERDETTKLWRLFGTTGDTAYHDTPEALVRRIEDGMYQIGEDDGYDAVILTDVSSSFESWHRASAGVPEDFAKRVRERVGARVPLFAAMIAFDKGSNIPFDAASFDDSIIWFAAKSNSKPGTKGCYECW